MKIERQRPATNANTSEIISKFSNERSKAQNTLDGLSPEQFFAVNISFAENLLGASKRSARKAPPIQGLIEPGMSRREKRGSHVIGLLQAYMAQEKGEDAVAEFKDRVGQDTATKLLDRLNRFLPGVKAQRDSAFAPQIIRPDEKLLKLFDKAAKQVLPYLRRGEPINQDRDREIIRNHIGGLSDGFHALQMGDFAGRKWMEEQHGERADYLLSEAARCVAPVLDEQLARVHSPAEDIQPYDVKLAKKRVQRRSAWLPEAQRDLFSEISHVEPKQKAGGRAGVALAGLVAGVASMFATDGLAGAVAGPVQSEHFQFLESVNGGLLFLFWAATYSVYGHSVYKNIVAQNKLRRETGMSVNVGSVAGGTISEASGASSEKGDKFAGMSQATFEMVKDTMWNIAIVGALIAGTISLRNATIFSAFANIGGLGYEYTVAAVINHLLQSKRNKFNEANPFPKKMDVAEAGKTVFSAADLDGERNISL